MNCRHCNSKLEHSFLDLGSAPPSNAYLTEDTLNKAERWYPLHVMVCGSCWLVQTEDFVDAKEMFSPQYAYFSSFSSSYLLHAKEYVQKMVSMFSLNDKKMVVEIAANDGYLLKNVKEMGIPCYGVEPTKRAADAAQEQGIEIVQDFFGCKLADELVNKGHQADLTVANNVLAHVPDINDFVRGFSKILKKDGVATFENPHLLSLVAQNQFDTIYHEHYSYLSLSSVIEIFKTNGLTLFDVEELSTHGGSLRYYAQRSETGKRPISNNLKKIQEKEDLVGIRDLKFYKDFQKQADSIKMKFLFFLLNQKAKGKTVAAYGAAAKGNTMLNFCGIKNDLLEYIVDKNPIKQGKFSPGSRIPIVNEQVLLETKPDFIVILPWNLKEEICKQLSYVYDWGCKFVVVIPDLKIF